MILSIFDYKDFVKNNRSLAPYQAPVPVYQAPTTPDVVSQLAKLVLIMMKYESLITLFNKNATTGCDDGGGSDIRSFKMKSQRKQIVRGSLTFVLDLKKLYGNK
ncbi:5554_t:CDS:2 [Entrophospora sp. SA101]|nr:5554_t:CDS:2 [Entrophospora sp. SA101]CAJ0917248.1 2801_t:CDS:2 [Entrophospora sp. SA101]